MPINYEATKTLIKGLVQKMKSFRGNWEQNDPTADDYIKNRPFYTEDAEIVILPETTVNSEGNVNIKSPLVVGQEYKITWNGVIYRSIAREYDGFRMIGNNAVYEYDNGIENNTGEPFAAETEGDDLKLCFFMDDTVTEPPTVSITTIREVVHKIDRKYIDIPTNLATTDDVQTVANDVQSVANDVQSVANDVQSVANDVNKKMDATNPVGTGSFSMNRKAGTVVGRYSHAEGYGTTASGVYSHAEGCETTASNEDSHSEGNCTKAFGMASHAEGHFTIASGKNQHVQGKYNIEDTEDKYSHIVGNGSWDKRSNAHTLDWNGNAWFQGDVYVGGTGQDDEAAERLAKMSDIPSLVGNKIEVATTDYINDIFRTSSIKDAREKNKTMISFTDDDCKMESYIKLFNEVIQETNIPYTFACPVGSISNTNDDGYITLSQLKTMYDAGVKYSCHLINEGNMESFGDVEAFDEELQTCMDTFNSWGINDVKAYAYCNGIVVDDYINVIKKYFDIGMTVKKGINKVPYETYFMNRVEVFSNKSAVETVSEQVTYVTKTGTVTETVTVPTLAKSYVDQLITDGSGWLIFMTHAWYKYYDSNQLLGLIKYIKSKGIEIVGLDEGIKLTSNVIDTGLFKKPLENAVEPYFVLDSNGEIWSNAIHDTSLPEGIENVKLELQHGYMLDPSTGKKTKTSDTGYKVTQFVDISGYDAVLITGWAYEGWNVYSFFDAGGAYLGKGYTSTTTYNDGGDTFNRVLVEIPEGASQILIAGNTYQTLPALTKIRADRYITKKETLDIGFHEGYKLSPTTGKTLTSSDSKYIISAEVYASEGEVYELTCSSNYNNALYVIYKTDGTIECLADTTNSLDGTAVNNLSVTMPKGTSYFRVACNKHIQLNGYVIKKVVKEVSYSKYNVALSDCVGKNVCGNIYTIDNVEVVAGTGAEVFNDYTHNIATGSYSHAEGGFSYAAGDYSHAEGLSTIANSNCSHAEGNLSVANGDCSHAEGEGTVANGSHQHVQGRYNIADEEDKYAHIVGNGNSYDDCSNAHTVDWDGNGWYAGHVECTHVVLVSPNGTRFAVSVDDNGNLSASTMT